MHFIESTFQEQWVADTLLNGAPKNVQWSIRPTPGRTPTLTATCTNQISRTESQELHIQPSPTGALGYHLDILQTLINSNPEDTKDSSWVPSARSTTHSGAQTLLRATNPPTHTVALRIWNQEPTGISTGVLRPFTSWVLTTQATHAKILPSPPGTLPTVTLTSSQRRYCERPLPVGIPHRQGRRHPPTEIEHPRKYRAGLQHSHIHVHPRQEKHQIRGIHRPRRKPVILMVLPGIFTR